jgi:hypothetical protein
MMLSTENGPSPLKVLVSTLGELMEDGHPELKKRLRTGLGVLAGIFLGQCIGQYVRHRYAFHHQGFKAFQWDRFFLAAFGAIGGMIGARNVSRNNDITRLGIGEPTTRKLR